METVSYSIARTEADIIGAKELIQKQYQEKGYLSKENNLSEFNSLFLVFENPKATVFVARFRGAVIGTVTVVEDSPCGLPIDAEFRREVDDFRALGETVAEVSRFAVDTSILDTTPFLKKRAFISFPLLHLVFRFAVYKRINRYCIEVNPKHTGFYRTFFFQTIGGARPCMFVKGAPAVLQTVHFDETFFGCARTHKFLASFLFGSGWSDEVFDPSKEACLSL